MPTVEPYHREKDVPPGLFKWVGILRREILKIPTFTQGSGSPEGVKVGIVGDQYLDIDGTGASSLYIKKTATGNTGWLAIG